MHKINMLNDDEGLARLIGHEIVQNRGAAVLFISPDNSYYSEENIYKQIEGCMKIFSKVYVMIPEEPLIHNYLATGYDYSGAQRKARLKCNSLRNKSKRSLESLTNDGAECAHIIDWKNEINENENYKLELNKFMQLYESDKNFEKDVNDAVRKVLEKKTETSNLTSENIVEGSKYVLEELAFISAAPLMLNVNELAFVYHKDWIIVENYISGKYEKEEKQKLGFVVMS